MFSILIEKLLNSDRVLARSAATFIVRALGTFSAFILNIVIARVLGLDGSGIYFLSITILMTISMFIRFGLDNALIKFIGIEKKENNFEKIENHILTAIVIVLTLGAFISTLLFFTGDFLEEFFFKSIPLSQSIPYISAGLIPLALVWTFSGIFKGLKFPARAGFIETASIPFFTIGIVLIANQWVTITPPSALLIYVISSVVTILIALVVLKNENIFKLQQVNLQIKLLVRTAYPFMLVSMTGFLILWLPSLILGSFTDAASVALYNVSFRSATIISFILVVMNSILSPRFAALYNDKNLLNIEDLAIKASLLMTVLILPLSAILLIWPQWILALFGKEFTNAAWLLRIMCIGQIINVVSGSVGYILMMTGHEHEMKNIMFIILLISLIMNLILINLYGVIGAAITVSFCLVLQNILMTITVHRKLGIFVLPRVKNIKILLLTYYQKL